MAKIANIFQKYYACIINLKLFLSFTGFIMMDNCYFCSPFEIRILGKSILVKFIVLKWAYFVESELRLF
jgi:hypothetical protein